MKDYTIAETYTLPSEGKIYEGEVSPEVRIRSMTTEEEQKRLAITDFPYRMLCEIIDDCIVDDIGISSYDMCIGDYQFLLHKLRSVTYGSDYNMSASCIYCGCVSPENINLDELPIITFDEKVLDYLEFDLPKSGEHVRLNVQTPRMLDKVNEKVKEYKKKGGLKDPTLTYTLASLIREVNGKKIDPLKLEEWVSNLPMADVNTIITYAEKVNNSVGVDTRLIITCNICGLSYESGLKMTQEFFRPALDI